MIREKIYIENIPAIIWREKSNKAYIFVHGKLSNKESAEEFAAIATDKGYQTISFDLPEHGERSIQDYKCDIFNGITDLIKISEYVFERWEKV
jgi:alpha-beta hydrolase superfamily lysophospholipase